MALCHYFNNDEIWNDTLGFSREQKNKIVEHIFSKLNPLKYI